MFPHNKRLQYTVRVSQTNPALANLMLEQFGGPQGELAAAMRYFTQAVAEDDPGRKDLLYDIATEELSHLEVIGTIVCMLNKGMRGAIAEGLTEQGELFRRMNAGSDSHVTSLLYGAGAPLTNSAGVPWTAAHIDTIGEPTADLRSNIAAEARAKMIYERLINCTDDAGVAEALGFLMTREVAHQKAFEKALYSIEPNFPPGKLPGVITFACHVPAATRRHARTRAGRRRAAPVPDLPGACGARQRRLHRSRQLGDGSRRRRPVRPSAAVGARRRQRGGDADADAGGAARRDRAARSGAGVSRSLSAPRRAPAVRALRARDRRVRFGRSARHGGRAQPASGCRSSGARS
jgi:Mn-containing catalase